MCQELPDTISIAFDKLKVILETESSINENNLDEGFKFVFERLSLDPEPNDKNK